MKEPPNDPVLWKKVKIRGGEILANDPALNPISYDTSLSVKIEPGEFDIYIRVQQIRYGVNRPASFKIVKFDAVNQSRVKIGELSVDHAIAGIVDIDTLSQKAAKFPAPFEDYLCEGPEWMNRHYGERKFKAVSQYFVSSGLGDGAYPVFAIIAEGRKVGLEIEFSSLRG